MLEHGNIYTLEEGVIMVIHYHHPCGW